ncbi:hypothetical protein EW145_g1389 [Phellinidium pouzarii]|uniref:Chromo domain-containing protein n=1 Tax=Phellinidium pouzarii TaxID=167371 RepID=A0A4S4LGI8_9AGAM|nr:hypothetical protein EW145_g1389 [Phellinidium pouzarii]
MSDDEMNIDDAGGVVRRRGRGFQNTGGDDAVVAAEPTYDRVEPAVASNAADTKAARSVEGWIVLVANVHEEATEEEITDRFAEYGEIKNLHMNLDRRTGYVKGYALVEYETLLDAQSAIDNANGTTFLEQELECDFAFSRSTTSLCLCSSRPSPTETPTQTLDLPLHLAMAHVEETDDISVDNSDVEKPKSKSSVAAERSTSKNKAAEKQSSDGEESGDGDEDEEEYEIEAIIDARRGKFRSGEYGYLVKWKGYGPEHNSWVSEADAGNAKELIDEFFRKKTIFSSRPVKSRGKISKTPKEKGKTSSPAANASASVAKRARGKSQGKTSVSDDDTSEDDLPKTKKARVGTSANGSTKRGSLAALDKTDDEDISMGTNGVEGSGDARPYTTMKELRLSSIKNWEDYVKHVKTVERLEEGLMIYFETVDDKYVREPSTVCAKRFPQKLIEFYESHLRWKLADDDVDS